MPAIDPVIDKNMFAVNCIDAARTFGTDPIYLLAVAYVESGIQNIGTTGSTAFGPFQILAETWASYMNDPDLMLTTEQRYIPYMQPGVAAKIAAEGSAALSATWQDNRVPTAQELYFVHLFGKSGACIILGGNYGRSIRDALLQVYAGPKASDQADQVIAANKSLMTDPTGQPLVISALLAAVGVRLDAGIAVALPLINAVAPDLYAGPPPANPPAGAPAPPNAPAANDATTPWMTVAKQELANHVVDGTARVAQYFTATTMGPLPPGHVAWCAAFVAFCKYTSGIAALHQPGSARAADWLNVGAKLPGPAYGAIAVLEPLAAGSSGHTGFVVSWTADKFQLLAGNQHPTGGGPDEVCIAEFNRSLVRGWRMLQTA
jgi:uncharacterized protein (TIGR02594 family)